VVKDLDRGYDNPCCNGRSMVFIFHVKQMASNSKMEIKNFNGQSFEFWNLKMEALLVEKD
jgi:hypothetical protein